MNDITIVCQDGYTYGDNKIIDGLYKKMRLRKDCRKCNTKYCENSEFHIYGCNNCRLVHGERKLCNVHDCSEFYYTNYMRMCHLCEKYFCAFHYGYRRGFYKCKNCIMNIGKVSEETFEKLILMFQENE